MKVVYVILHYNTFSVTSSCIESILNICSNGSELVVVDNNSSNDSGILLKKKYSCSKLHFIINKENVGFAKGNNIGYCYAKNELNADIIIVMNNDIVINQYNFEKCIENVIDEYNDVDVIAPDIVNISGKHQNPYKCKPEKTSMLVKSLVLNSVFYVGINIKPIYYFIMNMYSKYAYKHNDDSQCYKESKLNIVPHGACIIYTKRFVDDIDFAFVPITFFYGEENILYDYMYKNNRKTLYSPGIKVFHYEKASTKSVSMDMRKREIFKVKNRVKSLFKNISFRIQKGISYRKVIEK